MTPCPVCGKTLELNEGADCKRLGHLDGLPTPKESGELAKRLDIWADARERRNGPDGHGKTGTDLLRQSAERIRHLERCLEAERPWDYADLEGCPE